MKKKKSTTLVCCCCCCCCWLVVAAVAAAEVQAEVQAEEAASVVVKVLRYIYIWCAECNILHAGTRWKMERKCVESEHWKMECGP